MKIEEIEINKLIPAEYNPRKADKKEWKNLENSIKEFGLVDPIIVNSASNRKNTIIGGHFRCKVAESLGIKKVPVVYVNIPNLEKEKELNLRLNRNLGEWDFDLLANFEEELLKEVGFEKYELDKLIDVQEDNFNAQKEYEKIGEPITKLGDLWELGGHRLLCGNSESEEDFKKLTGKEKAQMVFTDPPFNVNYDYWGFRKNDNFRKKQKTKKWEKQIFNDKKKPAEYTEFIFNFLNNCYKYSKDNAVFYCYYGTKNENLVRTGIENANWYVSQTLIWLKPNLVISPGQDYHRIYEPCYFGWKKGKKHFINKKYGQKFTELQNLDFETFEEYLDILYEKRDVATMNYIHPTQKPVRLAERALKRHSEEDDIILEPFNGSGSTMIACEQLKRKCYAIELDPRFCDVAIKRWEQFTNKKAIKLNV